MWLLVLIQEVVTPRRARALVDLQVTEMLAPSHGLPLPHFYLQKNCSSAILKTTGLIHSDIGMYLSLSLGLYRAYCSIALTGQPSDDNKFYQRAGGGFEIVKDPGAIDKRILM